MELSEEEKEAIENIDLLVHCLNYGEQKMTIASERQKEIAQELQKLLNLVEKQQKETEREKQYTDFYKDLCNKQQKIIKELQKDKKVLIKNYDKVLGTFICKEKIRDYFAHDLAFKRRLIREKEEISDYNRGKFDTIEDLLERLEDNKWN